MQNLARWNNKMSSINEKDGHYKLSIIYVLSIAGSLLKPIHAFNFFLPSLQQRDLWRQISAIQQQKFITMHKSTQNENDSNDDALSQFNIFASNSPRTWKQRKSSETQGNNRNFAINEDEQQQRRRLLSFNQNQRSGQNLNQRQQTQQRLKFPFPNIPDILPFNLPSFSSQNIEQSQTNQFQSTTTLPIDRSFSTLRQRQNQQSRISDENPKRRRVKTMPMPVRGYDAFAIEEYYDYRPLEVAWRLNSLGLPLLGKLRLSF
jgi:hypothetical protein